jgi:hypothetical protein
MCTDCISSLSKKTETDRYSPFVIATNDALEKLQNLNIQGLKRAPEGLTELSSWSTTQTRSRSKVARLRHTGSQTL